MASPRSFYSRASSRTPTRRASRDYGDAQLSLVVYDFAGQDPYLATHPLFMTAESLYVLTGRLDELASDVPEEASAARRRLKSWMRLIHARTPSAKVVVVLTHADTMAGNTERIQRMSHTPQPHLLFLQLTTVLVCHSHVKRD